MICRNTSKNLGVFEFHMTTVYQGIAGFTKVCGVPWIQGYFNIIFMSAFFHMSSL